MDQARTIMYSKILRFHLSFVRKYRTIKNQTNDGHKTTQLAIKDLKIPLSAHLKLDMTKSRFRSDQQHETPKRQPRDGLCEQ